MSFTSQAQRRFVYSKHPDLAREYEAKTPPGPLPAHAPKSSSTSSSSSSPTVRPVPRRPKPPIDDNDDDDQPSSAAKKATASKPASKPTKPAIETITRIGRTRRY